MRTLRRCLLLVLCLLGLYGLGYWLLIKRQGLSGFWGSLNAHVTHEPMLKLGNNAINATYSFYQPLIRLDRAWRDYTYTQRLAGHWVDASGHVVFALESHTAGHFQFPGGGFGQLPVDFDADISPLRIGNPGIADLPLFSAYSQAHGVNYEIRLQLESGNTDVLLVSIFSSTHSDSVAYSPAQEESHTLKRVDL